MCIYVVRSLMILFCGYRRGKITAPTRWRREAANNGRHDGRLDFFGGHLKTFGDLFISLKTKKKENGHRFQGKLPTFDEFIFSTLFFLSVDYWILTSPPLPNNNNNLPWVFTRVAVGQWPPSWWWCFLLLKKPTPDPSASAAGSDQWREIKQPAPVAFFWWFNGSFVSGFPADVRFLISSDICQKRLFRGLEFSSSSKQFSRSQIKKERALFYTCTRVQITIKNI